MNVLFKMKKLYDIVITMQSQRTLGKQALPCALFFISLTTVCLSNSSKMYFHFSTPRLRKHVSLKGFSYTISEMAIQKKPSLDYMTCQICLASWQINVRADLRLRVTCFCLYSCFSGPFPIPSTSQDFFSIIGFRDLKVF